MYCFNDKDRYWENDLLSLFATLESISSSKNNIGYLDVNKVNMNPYYQNSITDSFKEVNTSITKVATIVYLESHYAVLIYDRIINEVSIYDGMHCNNNETCIQIWRNHILYLIFRIAGYRSLANVTLSVKNHVVNSDLSIIQNDGYNCGPIACINIWFLFNPDQASEYINKIDCIDIRKIKL